MLTKALEALLGFFAFFGVGLTCLVWPKKIQEWGLRYAERARILPHRRWCRALTASTYFLVQLRISGIVSIAISLVLLYVVFLDLTGR